MTRFIAFLCAGWLLLPFPPRSVPGKDEPPPVADPDQVRKGMTAAEVRKLLGPPKRVARQILYRRHLELWTYEPPLNVRIEFECPRGDDPTVLSVQPREKLAPSATVPPGPN
jgi:hypothetical protein